MTFARLAILLGMTSVTQLAVAQTLDYEVYKKSVEPIFAKKRAGHARCVACHSASNNAFRLQPLAEGSAWTDEQSRRNFESVSKLVNMRDRPQFRTAERCEQISQGYAFFAYPWNAAAMRNTHPERVRVPARFSACGGSGMS